MRKGRKNIPPPGLCRSWISNIMNKQCVHQGCST
nr:MAG TPA: LIN37 [Caudoviricetes sp.]